MSQLAVVIYRNVQIHAGSQKACVPGSGPYLSKRAAAREGMADIRVTAMMDRERPKPRQAEHFARRQKSSTQRGSLQRHSQAV